MKNFMLSFFLICCAVPIRAGAADFLIQPAVLKLPKPSSWDAEAPIIRRRCSRSAAASPKQAVPLPPVPPDSGLTNRLVPVLPAPAEKTAGAKKPIIRPCPYQTVPDRAGARNILLLNRNRETNATTRPVKASPALKEMTAAVRHVTASITSRTDREVVNMTAFVPSGNIWTILAAAVCLVPTMPSATVRKPGKKSTAVHITTIYAAVRLLSATRDIIYRPAVFARNAMK